MLVQALDVQLPMSVQSTVRRLRLNGHVESVDSAEASSVGVGAVTEDIMATQLEAFPSLLLVGLELVET